VRHESESPTYVSLNVVVFERWPWFIVHKPHLVAKGQSDMVCNCWVTDWLEELKRCDPFTAQKSWERYIKQLFRLARKQLGQLPRPLPDEEDVALAAFDTFWEGMEAGRFPKLDDRNNRTERLNCTSATVKICLRTANDAARSRCRRADRAYFCEGDIR
jgi:hypothetical protein